MHLFDKQRQKQGEIVGKGWDGDRKLAMTFAVLYFLIRFNFLSILV